MTGTASRVVETVALRPTTPTVALEPQDEFELTTVRAPDFARMASVQRTVRPGLPNAAARAGLPDLGGVRPLAVDLAASSASSSAPRSPYRERPEVRAFIERMVSVHGLDRAELERLIFAVPPPPPSSGGVAEGLPWWQYRQRFVTPELRQRGVEFARRHDAALREITRTYRVDRRAILGIAGVETRYGGFTGNVRVLPALTRLAFDDERRQDYFRSELEALLLLARDHGLDLRTLEGSYAGALGIPQFMPSNYRNLAVRYRGEGRPNLWEPLDAVASIANYFVRYDPTRAWQYGEPVVAAARVRGSVPDALLNTVTSLDRLRQSGVEITGDTGNATTGRLIKMQRRDGSFEYWVGLPNFEAIRSYNPSNNYALAVAQLGDEVLRGVNLRP